MMKGVSPEKRCGDVRVSHGSLRSDFEKLGVKAAYRSTDVEAIFERALTCHHDALRMIVADRVVPLDIAVQPVAGDIEGLAVVSQLLSEVGEFHAALQVIAYPLLACRATPESMKMLLRLGTDLLRDSRACIDREIGARLRRHVHALAGLGVVDDVSLTQPLLCALDERLPGLPAGCEESDMLTIIDQLALCLDTPVVASEVERQEIITLLARACAVGAREQICVVMEACLTHLDALSHPYAEECRNVQRGQLLLMAMDDARNAMERAGWTASWSKQGICELKSSGGVVADYREVLGYAKACFRCPPELVISGLMRTLRHFAWTRGVQVFAQCLPHDMPSEGILNLLSFLDVQLDEAQVAGREWPADELKPLRDFLCSASQSGLHDTTCCDHMYRTWVKLVKRSDFSIEFAREARHWDSQRIGCRALLTELSGTFDTFLSGLLLNLMDGISFSAAALVAQQAPQKHSLKSPLRVPVLAALLHDECSSNPAMDMKAAVRLLVRCLPEGHESKQGFATILAPVLLQCPEDSMEALLNSLAPSLDVREFAVPADAAAALWSAGLLPESTEWQGESRGLPSQGEVDRRLAISGDETHFQSKLQVGLDRRFELMAVAILSLMAKGRDDWSKESVGRFIELADRVSGWYPENEYALLLKAAIVMEVVDCCGAGALRDGLRQLVFDLLGEYSDHPLRRCRAAISSRTGKATTLGLVTSRTVHSPWR